MELNEEEYEALKDFVEPAEREDNDDDKPDDDAAPQEAAITRAVNRISKDVAKSVELAVSKVTKAPAQQMPNVAAEAKGEVFKSAGHMLYHVWRAKTQNNQQSRRMLEVHQKAAPLGANEGTPADGGFNVKPIWADSIFDKVRAYPKLLDKTQRVPIKSNTFNIPTVSEASLEDGVRHGGVLAYWVAEGDTATSSFPALGQVQAVLNTQIVLAYCSNQLLHDANIEAFDSFLGNKVGDEFVWQENEAVINGAGTTQPVGVLNQPALYTVATSTAAGQISFSDLTKMYSHLYSSSRANAAWYMCPQAYDQMLRQVFITQGNTVTTYPAHGITWSMSDDIPMKIFGRPVVECMNCSALGTEGDVILADLSQLTTAEMPGLEADVSYEIQFTTYQTAFRFVRRYDIRSGWLTSLKDKDGVFEFSPFVSLASRGT